MHGRKAAFGLTVGILAAACTTAAEPGPTVARTMPATSAATSATTTAPAPPSAEHRIQVRSVDGAGEFYDAATGERFVPRGMNYNRFLPGVGGPALDSVLSTRRYDPETVDDDFAAIRALGFNVVRIMIDTCGVRADGCITDERGLIDPAYITNLVDLLERAKAHGLFVMVASNTLPDDGYWINATAALQDDQFESANNEFLNPKAVPIYVDYWESVVGALVASGAPLDAIWAYELRQEHHFHWNYAPMNLEAGLITTANGLTYDLANSEAKAQMIDEGLVYWTDTLRSAIRALDPTALVTVGFFVPNDPNPVHGPDETRLVRTAYFLRNSSMDFVDLHHYRGNGVDDTEIWENFGLEGVEGVPIVLGEHGAIRDWYSSEDRGAAAVLGLEVDSCRVGFDGWLVWAWRGDVAADIWWASEGEGMIARVVAPVERPDPCAYSEFDFIRFNVAPQATVTASSAVDANPVQFVTDETPRHWNAAAAAPQWVELALVAPTDVTGIVLSVAQDPPGPSIHELWVRQDGGELVLVQTFDGPTAEGDVLTYSPTEALTGVDLVRVVTTSIGDLWPAWHEIEILTATPQG
jgi:hypothetical protein